MRRTRGRAGGVLVEVVFELVGVVRRVEREYDGVRHPQDLQTKLLRDGDLSANTTVSVVDDTASSSNMDSRA